MIPKLPTTSRRDWAVVILVAGGVAALPLLTASGPLGLGVIADRWITIGVLAAVYTLLALGLQVISGWAGQFLLGYGGFFAIGAYTYGVLNSAQFDAHLGGPLSMAIAVGLCLAVACVVGLPSFRVRGDYFALLSLAFGEIVRVALINLDGVTGGNAGLVGVDPFFLLPDQGGPVLVESLDRYMLGWAMVAVVALWLVALRGRPVGRAWVAVRDDEEAARSLGVRVLWAKMSALLIAAGIAGVAGCLFASHQLALSPPTFGIATSFLVVSAIVVGGMGSITGAVLGTALLLAVPEVLRDLGQGGDALLDYRMLIYGGALLAVVLVRPKGLLAEPRRSFRSTALSHGKETVPSVRMEGAVLEVDGLTSRYGGVVALDAVTLKVGAGQLVGLIGANGSGKTTLINVLSGFHDADSGSIRVDGEDVTRWSPERRARAGIARTFQMNRLFEEVSIAENVMVGSDTKLAAASALDLIVSRPRAADAERLAHDCLTAFPDRFPPRRWKRAPGELSYANRRRLEIARARATVPRILLLDEPTAGMNPVDRRALLRQARAWADQGCTVVVIEHELGSLAQVADRIVALDHGAVIAEGEPEKVLTSKKVVQALMSMEESGT